MQKKIPLKILDKRLENQYSLPNYATALSAAVDLKAITDGDITIKSGQCILIPTGFAIDMQDANMCAIILPRSGLGHKNGLVLGNGVGLIDADYQGEIKISALNRSANDFIVVEGMRIAQMVFMPIQRVQFEVVKEFSASERGAGGFGSTGS